MGTSQKVLRREKIKRGIRKRILGTSEKPRLTVFRSNKKIYAQIIDDTKGSTLVSSSSPGNAKGGKMDEAKAVGMQIAKAAKDSGIETVVFDRNGYLYHGRVAALAEGAREGGLKF